MLSRFSVLEPGGVRQWVAWHRLIASILFCFVFCFEVYLTMNDILASLRPIVR